jgi:hypothetical protein
MRLQPNIGSDRSWVWKVAADYTEEPPTAETLAIRFANSDNANEFKRQFELTQKIIRQSTARSLASASELHDEDSFVICTIDSNNLRRFPSSHDPLDISPLPPTRDYRIWVDASTDTGIGLLWNDRWAFWRTATDLCGPLQNIVLLEATAVELAVRLIHAKGIRDANVLIRSDNQGVIAAFHKGRCSNDMINLAIQRSEALLHESHVSLSLMYVHTSTNLADPISRGKFPSDVFRLSSPPSLPDELFSYFVQ